MLRAIQLHVRAEMTTIASPHMHCILSHAVTSTANIMRGLASKRLRHTLGLNTVRAEGEQLLYC